MNILVRSFEKKIKFITKEEFLFSKTSLYDQLKNWTEIKIKTKMWTPDWNWLTRFLLGKDGRNGNIVMCTGWESGARVYVGHIVQLETAYKKNENKDTMSKKGYF